MTTLAHYAELPSHMTSTRPVARFQISVAAAITLTGWSERTVWRRIADGTIASAHAHGKAMIAFARLQPHVIIPLGPEDCSAIASADAGDAEAQNDLALLFLEHDEARGAIYWLEQAAGHGYPDSMYWLGRCFIAGKGVRTDENTGIMWISKAASLGHVIAQNQMQAMRGKLRA